MNLKSLPLLISLWMLQGLPVWGAPQSNIRTTGDNTGISFPEATKNARPINGNVRGVSFCQWISGFTDDCVNGFSDRPEPPESYVPASAPSDFRDQSLILSTGEQKALLKEQNKDGVLIAE